MLIGYARVSTSDQNLDMQMDALKQAGCRRTFTDVASGTKAERPGVSAAVAYAREGDTLVVWKLDRFGRSLGHLIEAVRQLQARGVGFRSLHENIDTTTSAGKLIFHVFGALAEFERDLTRERTMAGLASARARGRRGGRRRVLDDKQVGLLRRLSRDPANAPGFICETLGISRATFYRYLGPRSAAASAPPPRPPFTPPAVARKRRTTSRA
ncbi:MAG: recombinase family protein [Thermoleophilaceae bacterium]|nr:recombinase family protein [Thermoleophilaceae bacterium]